VYTLVFVRQISPF